MSRFLKVTGDGRGIDAQEVRRALAVLADPLHGIQLQAAPSWKFRTFDGADLDAMTAWCQENASATGIYYALNPVPKGLARRVLVGDAVYRRWLLIDVDRHKTEAIIGKDNAGQPIRNCDLSATDAEHEAARSLMLDVAEYLDGEKWPTPLTVDTGNGFHLLYRVQADNNELARLSIKLSLHKLADRFDDDRGDIGAECYDARRIAKLPGTWARRGPVWPERPYRMARIPYRMARIIGGPA